MAKVVWIDKTPILRDDWHLEDIYAQAEDSMGLRITEEQAIEVMRLIAKSFDSEIGINWEVIESAISAVVD